MTGAIIFDLDETLYPERRFALSGFAAVARHVERRFGVPACGAFRTLVDHLRSGRRPQALQGLCRRYHWSEDLVPELVAVIRGHEPRLRLPRGSRETLVALHGEWRLGLLTNGLAAVQRRKVAALGIGPLVDAVVFAAEHGTGDGKPDPVPFQVIGRCLDVAAERSVFVGDDPFCDIVGARRMGMHTIRVRRGVHTWAPVGPGSEADIVVNDVVAVPAAASRLLEGAHV